MSALRKLFVGGNWKCNGTVAQAKDIIDNVVNKLSFNSATTEVLVAPVSIHIPFVQQHAQKSVYVSAQNCSATNLGAFTGEIAPAQLKDLGVNWVIIGHSERRQYYGETNEVVGTKTLNALKAQLNVVACIGEKLEHRESNQTFSVVQDQLEAIRKNLQESHWANVVLAYEPVWAIGTGKVASPQQAQEVHAFIREWMTKNVSQSVSDSTRVIYGGSVTSQNSKELIGCADIDGFLVGGASLKTDFVDIVNSIQ